MRRALPIITIACFVALSLVVPALASSQGGSAPAATYNWKSFIDNHPTPLFYEASGIALGITDLPVVADLGNHRVEMYSSTGALLRSIGSDKPGSATFLQGPYGIATNAAGDMYVADNRVIELSPTGSVLRSWTAGVPANLAGISVDCRGNVYVVGLHPVPFSNEYDRVAVAKFSSSGSLIWTESINFSMPAGNSALGAAIATDQHGNLLLSTEDQKFCHSCNGVYYALEKISPTGTVLSDNQNVAAGGRSIAADDDGDIFATKAHEVINLTTSQSYGTAGCSATELGSKLQVATTSDGTLFVSDSQPGPARAFAGVIHRFNPTGATLLGRCPNTPTTFQQLDSVATGGVYVYVDDVVPGTIFRYGIHGKLLGSFHSGHASEITADRHSDVYFSVAGGALQKRSPQGKFLGQSHVTSIESATVARNGTIYALTVDGRVMVLHPIGSHKSKPIRSWWMKGWAPNQGGNNPIGITLDAQGNVWVADNRHNNLQKFSPTGRLLLQFGRKGSGPRMFMTPGALATDGHDHIFSVDLGNNRVQEFGSNGRLMAIYGREGMSMGQLQEPRGIAAGGNGVIYVGDSGNDRVQELVPNR